LGAGVIFEMRNKDELGREEGRKKPSLFRSEFRDIQIIHKNQESREKISCLSAKQEPFPSNLANRQTF
jgi:hypothetical protein